MHADNVMQSAKTKKRFLKQNMVFPDRLNISCFYKPDGLNNLLIILFFLAIAISLTNFARAEDMAQKAEKANNEDNLVSLSPKSQKKLYKSGTYRVRKIIDSLTIQLDNGDIIRLSALDIPGRHDIKASGHVIAGFELLKTLYEGKNIIFYQQPRAKKEQVNRMGHKVGHIVRSSDNIWAQGTYLANGLARVRTTKSTSALNQRLYEAEQEGRENEKGIWNPQSDFSVQILTPELSEKNLNSFQIVEGRIRKIATINNTIYLNFGQNWRHDFTIAIPTRLRNDLLRNDEDLLSMTGRTVRARGWVESYNGPFIKIDHIERLEFPETPNSDPPLTRR